MNNVKVIKFKEVKIRKDRNCNFCHHLIKHGNKMTVYTGVDMGQIYNCYYCTKCEKILSLLDWSEYEDVYIKDLEDLCYNEGVNTPTELLEKLQKNRQGVVK